MIDGGEHNGLFFVVFAETLESEVMMDFENELANDFETILQHIREETWAAFCEASDQVGHPPYTMLSRVLVKAVNERMEQLFSLASQHLAE